MVTVPPLLNDAWTHSPNLTDDVQSAGTVPARKHPIARFFGMQFTGPWQTTMGCSCVEAMEQDHGQSPAHPG